MARDCPSSSREFPTRQGDATLRFDQVGQDETFLLGEHSYDNFLDGLSDEVSFAVPKFPDRYQARPNHVIGPSSLPAAEPAVLRGVSTSYGLLDRRTVSPIPRLDTALGPNVDTTPVLVGETRVAAERTGKENASLVVMPIASQGPASNSFRTIRALNPRPQASNTSKIPVLVSNASSAERLAQAFSAFDSLDEQLNNPTPQRQPDTASKSTSHLASGIPALTQRILNSSSSDPQPLIAQTTPLSTSLSSSLLFRQQVVDGAAETPSSFSSPNINEELLPIFRVSQIPTNPRRGSHSNHFETINEDAILDYARDNGAPLANDAAGGAMQNPLAARHDARVLPPPPHPVSTKSTTLAHSAGGQSPSEMQPCLSGLAHAAVAPTLSPSENAHARARSSLNHPMPVSTQDIYPPPSYSPNSAAPPEAVVLIPSSEHVQRERSVARRRSSGPTVPHWVHFVEADGSGHNRSDDTSRLSPTAALAPLDFARGKLLGPFGDELGDAGDITTPNLATVPLVNRVGELSFDDPQNVQSMVAEAATLNTPPYTTPPHNPCLGSQTASPLSAINQAGVLVERAESSHTNVANSASAEPVQELMVPLGAEIKDIGSSRVFARPSKLAPTVGRPAKDTVARKASAHKLKNRTNPIQDVAYGSRGGSNVERSQPKPIMRAGQVESRGRPQTKASIAAPAGVGVERKASHPTLDGAHVEPVPPDPDVNGTLRGSKRDPETTDAVFHVRPPPPPSGAPNRGPQNRGREGVQHSLRHYLSDTAERPGVLSLSQSTERVPSPRVDAPRTSLVDQEDGAYLSVSNNILTQTAPGPMETEGAAPIGIQQLVAPPTTDTSTPAAVVEDKGSGKRAVWHRHEMPPNAPLTSSSSRQRKDDAASHPEASVSHKSFSTANKPTATAQDRPKHSISARSKKADNSFPQSTSRDMHVRSVPKSRVDQRTAGNPTAPVMVENTTPTHLVPHAGEPRPRHVLGNQHAIPNVGILAAPTSLIENLGEIPGGVTMVPHSQRRSPHQILLPESSDSEPSPSQYQALPTYTRLGNTPRSTLNQVPPKIIDLSELNTRSSMTGGTSDSTVGDKRAPAHSPIRGKRREKKRTRIESDSAQSVVPFPSLRSQRSHEPVAIVTIDESSEEPFAESTTHERHTVNAEGETLPLLVMKKAKRKSLDNADDENYRKRVRLHGRDPRRIVSHNTQEPKIVPSRRPPRGPAYLPIAQPLTVAVPGEASRLRAREREKRITERLEKERREKHIDMREKMGSLRLTQHPENRHVSSNYTASAPAGPFTFATDHRAEQHRTNFEARLAHWEIRTQEAIRQAQSVARRPVIPDYTSAQAEHAKRVLAARQAARTNVTEPKTPGLKTKRRMMQRRAFDEQLKEKEHQLQQLREARQEEEEEMECLRVKELRKKLDKNVKANPVPRWYRLHDEEDIMILEK